ncbi:hypothetical protein [Nonomuraea sp. CA-141351]|uniref:hypothetical protein n=1 Tax=Nonomuraea sp. CA-141351 TaxID=3239996 RepID=UPI003D90C55E
MRITAALTGGLLAAAAAFIAVAPAASATTSAAPAVTRHKCKAGGGTVTKAQAPAQGRVCSGGTHDGEQIRKKAAQ